MKKILLSLTILIFIGCNSDKREKSDKIKNSNVYRIEVLDREMYLPKDYEKSSIEAIAEFIRNSPDRDELSEYELQKLNNFERMGATVEIFVDKENYENNISFQPEKYIQMSKEAVEVYVDLLENNLFLEPKSRGIEYERLESKFLKIGLAKIVKVKYLQTFEGKKRYLTQYLVSHNLKAFGIIVMNEENKDFQYILNSFKI